MLETYELRKTLECESESQPKCQIQNVKVKSQGLGQTKGHIDLIGYNFASICHRDFKLGFNFSF